MTQQGYPFTLSKRILLKWGHDNYLRKTPALSMESANSRVVASLDRKWLVLDTRCVLGQSQRNPASRAQVSGSAGFPMRRNPARIRPTRPRCTRHSKASCQNSTPFWLSFEQPRLQFRPRRFQVFRTSWFFSFLASVVMVSRTALVVKGFCLLNRRPRGPGRGPQDLCGYSSDS